MLRPVDNIVNALREKGCKPRKRGEGYTALCPAHEDRRPSLSVGEGERGAALVHCHAGCDTTAVLAALGLTLRNLGPPHKSADAPRATGRQAIRQTSNLKLYATANAAVRALERQRGKRTGLWEYHNAAGKPVGIIVRFDSTDAATPGAAPGKTILPVSLVEGGWAVRGMPSPRPLYGLPGLLSLPPGSRVYIVEGEKCADAGRALGLTSTTSPHGAESAGKADWSALAGHDAVVIPDRDDPGGGYARDVADLASKAGARSVRVARLADRMPDLPAHGDIADFIERRSAAGADKAMIRREIEALADAAAIQGAEPMTICLADVKAEPIEWLWHNRIPLAAVSLIVGDPDAGKTFVTMDLAARVSTGIPMPGCDGEPTEPRGVLIINGEDDIARTIVPRLESAGADMSRVRAIPVLGAQGVKQSRRWFTLSDLPMLEKALRETPDVAVVIIDPVTAFLGEKDANGVGDVRGLVGPVSDVASRYGVAIIFVTHLNKTPGASALYRVIGSVGWTGVARAAWVVIREHAASSRRFFVRLKCNLAPETHGLAYSITGSPPRIVWEQAPVIETAEDLFRAREGDEGDRSALDEATDWLENRLAGGVRAPAETIKGEARKVGIKPRTLDRAKADLRVVCRPDGFRGPWSWSLPGDHTAPDSSESAEPEGMAQSEDSGAEWGEWDMPSDMPTL